MKKNHTNLKQKFISDILKYLSLKSFTELFIAALFLACTLEVIKHYDRYVSPYLENLAFIVAANSSAHDVGKVCDYDCTVIAEISENRFHTQYHESSPIDHCQFADDLNLINQSLKPKTLFIDYDLSPISYDTLDRNSDLVSLIKNAQNCQSKLDVTLDNISSKVHLVLIDPMSKDASNQVMQWVKDRKSRNILFADGNIKVKSGLTTTYLTAQNSVASVICKGMGCQNQSHLNNRSEADSQQEVDPESYINFKAYSKSVKLIAIENINSNQTYSSNGVVMVGGVYGKDDKFTTPLGDLFGIELHAASYVSQMQGVSAVHKLIVLVLDISVGMMVGFLAKLCWEYLLEDSSKLVKRKLFPLCMLILMFVFMSICVWLSLKISNFLMGKWSVWLNPAPIVIGMVLHAFVMTPGEMPGEILKGNINHKPMEDKNKRSFDNLFNEIREWLTPLPMAIPIFSLIVYGLFLYIFD